MRINSITIFHTTKEYVDRYTGIGDAISNEHIERTLRVLGFDVVTDNGKFTVKVPSFSCKDRTLTREEVQSVADGIIETLAKDNINLKS